ncbi:response regulator [Citrifermentans bremense]|uniref:response regulator n=1 Tax=Citrifermentans bremense TaxID=60035 RepID=UPI00040E5925|nr:response regulator [Citrifermentans bremense]
MLIVCPNCKKRFNVDPGTPDQPKKLRCSNCRAVFRLVRKGERSEGAKAKLKVVIANESAAFCQAVEKVLAHESFQLFLCTDGKEALETVQQVTPDVLLLDVALPTMFGFEVCERVRQDPALANVKIVLIASIYDKTRYKRSPNSLYGADDYIEKHHIPDSLVPMIYRLASGSEPQAQSPTENELAEQEETRSEIRQCEVEETSTVEAAAPAAEPAAAAAVAAVQPDQSDWSDLSDSAPAPAAAPSPAPASAETTPEHVKARRLARIIVSDIVLYNQAKVEQGVREGTFHQLLADDIREGENLYRQRVSQQVRDTTSFLKEAFEEVIAKKRAELNA